MIITVLTVLTILIGFSSLFAFFVVFRMAMNEGNGLEESLRIAAKGSKYGIPCVFMYLVQYHTKLKRYAMPK